MEGAVAGAGAEKAAGAGAWEDDGGGTAGVAGVGEVGLGQAAGVKGGPGGAERASESMVRSRMREVTEVL